MTDILTWETTVDDVVEAALQEPCVIGVVQTVAESDLSVREQLHAIDEVVDSPQGELGFDEARMIKREFVLMAADRETKRRRARKYSAYMGQRIGRSIL